MDKKICAFCGKTIDEKEEWILNQFGYRCETCIQKALERTEK